MIKRSRYPLPIAPERIPLDFDQCTMHDVIYAAWRWDHGGFSLRLHIAARTHLQAACDLKRLGKAFEIPAEMGRDGNKLASFARKRQLDCFETFMQDSTCRTIQAFVSAAKLLKIEHTLQQKIVVRGAF